MYDTKQTEASKGALVELVLALSAYREDFVLVGGWAPYFLTHGFFEHCGSIDVDLVLRPAIMARYESIRRTITELGYRSTGNPFRFRRVIKALDQSPSEIHLDFLTEPEGRPHVEGLVAVQENLQAVFVEGCSIVFIFNYEENVLGVLPSGGTASEPVRVADVVSALTMKGLALGRARKLEKDCYDIYAVAGFHRGSPEAAASHFKELVERSASGEKPATTARALEKIRGAFSTRDSYGALAVSSFMDEDVSVDASARVLAFLAG